MTQDAVPITLDDRLEFRDRHRADMPRRGV